MKKSVLLLCGFAGLVCLGQMACQAWDYEGHRFVNQLALDSLPSDFPAFVKTPAARERIAFLAGEPDRWRNTSELNHFNNPDHYIDLEELKAYGIDLRTLTPFRHDFTAQLALARAAHPEKFPPLDPGQNRDHTRQLVGFLPWAIYENYEKLKSGFSGLKTFEKSGTPAEIANAQQDIIYVMGVLGHYVGDAAQPLHTTIHFNGWVGANPQGYTTRKNFHADIDGSFRNLDDAGFKELAARIHPARTPGAELGMPEMGPFPVFVNYIVEQNKMVIPLYELEKAGKLLGAGHSGREGKDFLDRQLVTGGQMLGDIWYSAWHSAVEDTYLENALAHRTHPPGDPDAGK